MNDKKTIEELEAKIEVIKAICSQVRLTAIPSSMDAHAERMNQDLKAQMKIVNQVELVLFGKVL